jgi:hypothetical protein
MTEDSDKGLIMRRGASDAVLDRSFAYAVEIRLC